MEYEISTLQMVNLARKRSVGAKSEKAQTPDIKQSGMVLGKERGPPTARGPSLALSIQKQPDPRKGLRRSMAWLCTYYTILPQSRSSFDDNDADLI